MHAIKIFLKLCDLNVKKMLVFRASFFVTLGLMSMWVVAYIVLIEVIFYHTPTLAGWDKGAVLLIMCFYYYLQNFSDIFFKDNIEEFGENVRRGELDFKLTKPAPLRLLAFFWEIRFDHIAGLIATTALLFYTLPQLASALKPAHVLAGGGLLLVAILLYYSVLTSIAALTFWIHKNDTFNILIYNISQLSRYPRQIYFGVVGKILTFGLPLALVASIPAETTLGAITGILPFFFIGSSLFLYGVSRLLWYYGLRAYTSAS